MFKSVWLPLCLALALSVSPHEPVFPPPLIDSDFGSNTMFEAVSLPAEAAGCLCACVLPQMCLPVCGPPSVPAQAIERDKILVAC